MSNKCIVAGCNNHQHEGRFQTFELCAPCYYMLTSGTVNNNGTTFIHNLQKRSLVEKCCGNYIGCSQEDCVPRLQNRITELYKNLEEAAVKLSNAGKVIDRAAKILQLST